MLCAESFDPRMNANLTHSDDKSQMLVDNNRGVFIQWERGISVLCSVFSMA